MNWRCVLDPLQYSWTFSWCYDDGWFFTTFLWIFNISWNRTLFDWFLPLNCLMTKNCSFFFCNFPRKLLKLACYKSIPSTLRSSPSTTIITKNIYILNRNRGKKSQKSVIMNWSQKLEKTFGAKSRNATFPVHSSWRNKKTKRKWKQLLLM